MAERKYDGVLGKRLFISIVGSWDKDRHARYKRDCEERDAALFSHFDVDPDAPNAWRELAFALAERHVEAYGSLEPGRPKENADQDIWIAMRWQELVRVEGMTNIGAYKQISTEIGLPLATVKERMKRLKRSPDNFLLEFFKNTGHQLNTATIAKAFRESLTPDPELDAAIERRAKQLRRPPYE